jgi:hypothetical protein
MGHDNECVQYDIVGVALSGDSRILDLGHCPQRALDFGKLDPLSAHLHLIVSSADEYDQPVGALADQVAGEQDPL